MSLNLPDNISLPQSPARHNIAIAEITIFSAIILVQVPIRFIQEWRYWKHRKAKNVARCILFSWFRNLVALLAKIRIVGFALFLAVKKPTKALVISEVVLQGVGCSPLLLDLSLVLIRCGRVGLEERTATHFPRTIKLLLEWTRLPILIAIVLIIVAGCIVNTTCLKAGGIVLLVAYIYVSTITIAIIVTPMLSRIPKAGRTGLFIAAAVIPMYLIRIINLLLSEFGSTRFSPAIGDWRIQVGMEFFVEVSIVLLLTAASLSAEPIWGEQAGYIDGEFGHEKVEETLA